ncbi:endonuclease/exonuclease/phosphatase family protein (plasmid) [Photobacterium sp. DA100]|uniref:endonuclease/exonuclease/phosphatase family protein n=1 Tax=Photobacterium sp. DA100 TaxID=3027472 RepID=UPI00247A9512|nr:endonuclease/exonuclease/phosphatase family protein [Photobacterium sp. DA100]WEM45098.1 endonuclease/exonuclease/phosphatase family protein [Photobacterium sp. DA100]
MTASKLLLALGLLLSSPLLAAASSNSTGTVTITTWNLNWLTADKANGQQRADVPSRVASDYRALASVLNEISPDILAFQEVADPQSIGKVIPLNQYRIEFSSRKTQSNKGPWPQFVGFAIRKGIDYRRHPDLHQLDIWGNQYLRYGIDISLYPDGKNELRLLAVHLKSGCYSNRHRNKNCTVLKKQFEVLKNWIAKRQEQQQSFIILGDFNRRLANKGDKFWTALTAELSSAPTLATNGITSQCRSQVYNKRKRQWEVRQYPGFIDHFIVGSRIQKKNTTEVPFSEYLYTEQQLKQYQLSDHCPLSIMLQL